MTNDEIISFEIFLLILGEEKKINLPHKPSVSQQN